VFAPAVELVYGASLVQLSCRPPKMIIPVNQVGFGMQKAMKSRILFCG